MELLEAAAKTTDFLLKIAQMNRVRPQGEALTHCEGCEEEIPEKRRENMPGCTRCVVCQNEFEGGR